MWTGCTWRTLSPPRTSPDNVDSGNFIIIAGTTLALIALTWGGIRFPWNSAHVLAPLIVGLVLILLFFAYEWTVPIEPTTPLDVMKSRTAVSGSVRAIVNLLRPLTLLQVHSHLLPRHCHYDYDV